MHLLDTCTVSSFLDPKAEARTPELFARVTEVIAADRRAALAEITAYEIRRGLELLALRDGVRSVDKQRRTELFLRQSTILPLSSAFPIAARLWARGKNQKPAVNFGEADLITAACAIANGLTLMTTDAKLARGLEAIGLASAVEARALR